LKNTVVLSYLCSETLIQRSMNKFKDFLINLGFHCVVLGILGIFAIILLGFLTCCLGLPSVYFYIALGAGLALGITASICCMRKNCSLFRKQD
jgi:hypothetical protein